MAISMSPGCFPSPRTYFSSWRMETIAITGALTNHSPSAVKPHRDSYMHWWSNQYHKIVLEWKFGRLMFVLIHEDIICFFSGLLTLLPEHRHFMFFYPKRSVFLFFHVRIGPSYRMEGPLNSKSLGKTSKILFSRILKHSFPCSTRHLHGLLILLEYDSRNQSRTHCYFTTNNLPFFT